MTDLKDMLGFCPGCFASTEDGSWGHVVIGDHCTNCGANGTVQLPRWAVDSIRRQASWVGSRFYPSQEDRDLHRELRYLRSVAPELHIEVSESDTPGIWNARHGDRTQTFGAVSREHAVEQAQKSMRHPVPVSFERPKLDS